MAVSGKHGRVAPPLGSHMSLTGARMVVQIEDDARVARVDDVEEERGDKVEDDESDEPRE